MREQFYQRWVILNAAVALALVVALARIQQQGPLLDAFFGPPEARDWLRPNLLTVMLVLFPANGLYVMTSLHCRVTQVWEEHHFFWQVLLGISIAWGFIFPHQLARIALM